MNEMTQTKDFFADMSHDEQLIYIVEHLRCLPDDLVEASLDLLIKAGEIEYAVVLAREHGRIEKAISILVDAGDYLWASQIARSSGLQEVADDLLYRGLEYYLAMEMYGRAVSVAQALKLPADRIDAIFREGIAFECSSLDLSRARGAMQSMVSALIGMDDEISTELRDALIKEIERHEDGSGLKGTKPGRRCIAREDIEDSDSDDMIERGSFY